MKKVLFATTALVASAGIASADVAVTGSAEMGVVGGSAITAQFHQDIDVTFTMTGETDNGLSFGAAVDLDESTIADTAAGGSTNGAFGNNADDGGVAIFIKGAFGTLTMGDTDGGFDWALDEVALAGGSLADAVTSHGGYNGNAGLDGNYDGQIVRYDHSVGDFSFAVSVEADDTGANRATIFGVGGKYAGDLGGINVAIGAGYQTGGPAAGDKALGASLKATMGNGVTGAVNYSKVTEAGVETTHIGVGLGYSMDKIAVGVNYGQNNVTGGANTNGFGIAGSYDLGGGAKIVADYGSTSGGANAWSLGVAMSF